MKAKTEFLDMSKSPWNQSEHNIYKASTRTAAIGFAKSKKWSTKYIHPACSNVSAFWVIAQCNGDQMTFVKRDGTTVTLPYPGYTKK